MRAPHALIAGAGIGGLCAALCLARAGLTVTILERASALEEAGAGLQLSPNASVILAGLGLLAGLSSAALAPEAIRIRRSRDGATLSLMPLADAERRWEAPYLLIHRADLQRALTDAIAAEPAITLRTGIAVAGFAAKGDGVAVAAKRGLMSLAFDADLLIGADGLRSFVRGRLGADRFGAPRHAGRTAWRALVAADELDAEMRRPETTLWLGPKAHLVHYPLRAGRVVNIVAVVEDDWRPSETAELWSTPGDPENLHARFAAWDRRARRLLEAAPHWRKWPLFDLDPLPQWVAGRIALLGDAAHPMLPFLAQGAAQAIEDAGALAQNLAATLASGGSIEEGLAAYGDARRARTARIQAESRRQGKIYHLTGIAAVARNISMRALPPARMLARYDWLYRPRDGRLERGQR